VHSPGARQEQTTVLSHGVLAGEQVFQHRAAGTLGMNALSDVWELLRIAEKYDVLRSGADRERIGQRHLPGLIDEQILDTLLHAFASEEPGRAGDQVGIGALALLGFIRVHEELPVEV
jgi:hypothetical protein